MSTEGLLQPKARAGHALIHLFFFSTGLWFRTTQVTLPLRVEFLLKTDSGYPKDTGVNRPWQTLRISFAITPIGQLHQSPPSPIPGDFLSFFLPIRHDPTNWSVSTNPRASAVLSRDISSKCERESFEWTRSLESAKTRVQSRRGLCSLTEHQKICTEVVVPPQGIRQIPHHLLNWR